MKLIDKLNSINRPRILSLQLGHAYNMAALREQLLDMYNVDKSIVLQWHNLLMDYVKMDHTMLAIRGYNSFSPNKYDCLRRGFLTQAKNFLYFHTDNYFAAYFLKMCMDGYVPELSEFYDLMTTRQFPSRFGQITTQEKELMAIKQGKDPGINLAGFKLAHIIPVGKDYLINGRTLGIQEILNMYFPIGQRSDWKLHSDKFGTYYMRDLNETSPDMKKIAIAHFLRFVHPFNYFICPKKNCEANIMCKELAEYEPLLDNMHDFMLQTYGDDYKEYLSYILVDDKYGNDMYKETGEVKVIYGRVLESASPYCSTFTLKQLLKELLDGTISVPETNTDPNTDTDTTSQGEKNDIVEQEDTNDSKPKHFRQNTLRKSKAIELLRNAGYTISSDHTTFASKNRTVYSYWANPKFSLLRQTWYLILNDWHSRILYFFKIPANSIADYELVPRNDKPYIIDLNICYKDSTFTDDRSKYSFMKYKVAEIPY